jgi:hypothetical protein
MDINPQTVLDNLTEAAKRAALVRQTARIAAAANAKDAAKLPPVPTQTPGPAE